MPIKCACTCVYSCRLYIPNGCRCPATQNYEKQKQKREETNICFCKVHVVVFEGGGRAVARAHAKSTAHIAINSQCGNIAFATASAIILHMFIRLLSCKSTELRATVCRVVCNEQQTHFYPFKPHTHRVYAMI